MADLLVASADALESNQEKILGAASTMTTNTANELQRMASESIQQANFGFLGDRIKGTITTGINEAVANFAKLSITQEEVLFKTGIASLRNYALEISK